MFKVSSYTGPSILLYPSLCWNNAKTGRFKDHLDENIASNWEAVHFFHFQKQEKDTKARRTRTEGEY